jgi:hypothetical protein
MTLEELCSELGISVYYAKNQWAVVKAKRAMGGLYLYKSGRGKRAQYGVRRAGEEKVRWEHIDGNKL